LLDKRDLQDMGITEIGTVKKLMAEIQKLKRCKAVDPSLLLSDIVRGKKIGVGEQLIVV
jgi:hypothetical protein